MFADDMRTAWQIDIFSVEKEEVMDNLLNCKDCKFQVEFLTSTAKLQFISNKSMCFLELEPFRLFAY